MITSWHKKLISHNSLIAKSKLYTFVVADYGIFFSLPSTVKNLSKIYTSCRNENMKVFVDLLRHLCSNISLDSLLVLQFNLCCLVAHFLFLIMVRFVLNKVPMNRKNTLFDEQLTKLRCNCTTSSFCFYFRPLLLSIYASDLTSDTWGPHSDSSKCNYIILYNNGRTYFPRRTGLHAFYIYEHVFLTYNLCSL